MTHLQRTTNEILGRVESGMATAKDAERLREIISCLCFIVEEETTGVDFVSPEAETTWRNLNREQ